MLLCGLRLPLWITFVGHFSRYVTVTDRYHTSNNARALELKAVGHRRAARLCPPGGKPGCAYALHMLCI